MASLINLEKLWQISVFSPSDHSEAHGCRNGQEDLAATAGGRADTDCPLGNQWPPRPVPWQAVPAEGVTIS